MLASGVTVHLVENGGKPSQAAKMAARRKSAYAALAADLLSSPPLSSSSPLPFLGVDCEMADYEKVKGLSDHVRLCFVQTSSRRVVVIEALTSRRGEREGGLSDELRGILVDGEVEKVFCAKRQDVAALNAEMEAGGGGESGAGKVNNVRDVQTLARNFGRKGGEGKGGGGGVGKEPGLAKVLSFASRGLVFTKRSIKKEQWWRLRSPEEMIAAAGYVQYAAADAWGTWLSYELMRKENEEGGTGWRGEEEGEEARYEELVSSLRGATAVSDVLKRE